MARRRVEEELQRGRNILGHKPSDKWEKVKVVREVRTQARRQGLYCVQFSFEGDSLALGYGNGAVDLVNPLTGAVTKSVRESRHMGFQVMCLRFCPVNVRQLLISTSDGLVCLSDVETGQCRDVVSEPNNEINTLDFCNDGYLFATAGKDLGVRVYDTKTFKMVSEWEGKIESDPQPFHPTSMRSTMRIFCLKFHTAHEDLFVTGGWENQLKVWDIRSRDGCVRSISGPHICGDAIDMRGDEILTGSWVGLHALQTWNFVEGSKRKDIPFPHSDEGQFLYCAQFGANNIVLAGGSGTNSVEVVNMETNEHLGGIRMKRPVMAMDSTFGGRLFAVAGHDPVVKLGTIY